MESASTLGDVVPELVCFDWMNRYDIVEDVVFKDQQQWLLAQTRE